MHTYASKYLYKISFAFYATIKYKSVIFEMHSQTSENDVKDKQREQK